MSEVGSVGRLRSVKPNASTPAVLVVDDDADIRRALVSALKEQGYRAISACNGLEAIKVLQTLPAPPSMILLDLMMPVMDGWEFRAQQQQDPSLSKIPVVVCSAHQDLSEHARQLSASGFLTKPFQLEELLDMISKFCSDPVSQGSGPSTNSPASSL